MDCKESVVEYRANFLWPHEKGSIEEAGYEFINGLTEDYREQWWKILFDRFTHNLSGVNTLS